MATPSDTMGTMKSYTSAGRTRNVVNIASPGNTGVAYSFTATTNMPSDTSDGFKNFGQNRFLHVQQQN